MTSVALIGLHEERTARSLSWKKFIMHATFNIQYVPQWCLQSYFVVIRVKKHEHLELLYNLHTFMAFAFEGTFCWLVFLNGMARLIIIANILRYFHDGLLDVFVSASTDWRKSCRTTGSWNICLKINVKKFFFKRTSAMLWLLLACVAHIAANSNLLCRNVHCLTCSFSNKQIEYKQIEYKVNVGRRDILLNMSIWPVECCALML